MLDTLAYITGYTVLAIVFAVCVAGVLGLIDIRVIPHHEDD